MGQSNLGRSKALQFGAVFEGPLLLVPLVDGHRAGRVQHGHKLSLGEDSECELGERKGTMAPA